MICFCCGGTHDIEPTIEKIEPGSESDLHLCYETLQEYTHASFKQIHGVSKLEKIHKEHRLVLAHLVRTWLSSMFISHLPHELRPEEFGSAADCPWCSKIMLTPKGRQMLMDLKANGGTFYACSEDPQNHGPKHLKQLNIFTSNIT